MKWSHKVFYIAFTDSPFRKKNNFLRRLNDSRIRKKWSDINLMELLE